MTVKTNKPPTQIAGVNGFNAHGVMGEGEPQERIDWFKLVDLPTFQMFAAEQSGLTYGVTISNWIKERRTTLSDSVLYDQYAQWHSSKGYWPNETPMGELIKE